MDTRLFMEAKNDGFHIKKRKDLSIKINNNSADFITPNFSHGCEAGCSYCYVARHNQFGNPMTVSENTEELIESIVEHFYQQPSKYPDFSNQQDRWHWVYDIGECTDMMSVRYIELTNYIVRQLVGRTNLKPTFATKLANKFTVDMLDSIYDIRPFHARIRVSLMPQNIADVVEVGTSKIKDRIEAIKLLYDKGYEVHINFSPIILYSTWALDYIELMKEIDSFIMSQNAYYQNKLKNMMACEIIFLTHHEKLHESNLRWNPEAEEVMWNPDMQELKVNKRGASDILRYNIETKKTATKLFKGMLSKYLPYCRVRYAF